MEFEWHDFVGVMGVVTLLSTYLLLQLNRMDARSLLYSQLNALGALLIMISLSQDFNLSAFVMEATWFIISIIGVAVTISNKRRENLTEN